MQIEHFQFVSWEDDAAVKEEKDTIEALDFLVKKVEEKRLVSNKPILVHCSAGIGRTGTFLAICLIIESLKKLL